jgi:hypothetical protein
MTRSILGLNCLRMAVILSLFSGEVRAFLSDKD